MEIERDNNVNSAQAIYNGENAKNMGKKILKPIVQEKIVKVPVTQYVEKIIEREEIKYVNKYVDVIKPIITYKTKHILKPIYLDKIKYETKVLEKEKIIHIPKIEYKNKIVEIPVYVHREKIIEKKVPLIIERVIPVLKVKTEEKNVLADTIAMPGICDMSDNNKTNKHFKIITENYQRENFKGMSMQKMSFISNMRSNEVDSSNMQTYRLQPEYVYENKQENTHFNMVEKKINESSSSRNSVQGDSESNNDISAPVKHNTEYQEETNEEIHEEAQSEEAKEEINIAINAEGDFSEKKEHIVDDHFYNMGSNSDFNTTRVSVYLSEHGNGREGEAYEQSCAASQSNYNASLNMINMSNSVMCNDNNSQMHIMKNGIGNKSASEQAFKHTTTEVEQKVYSFPVHGNYQENSHGLIAPCEQNDCEQSQARINKTPISREQFNSYSHVQAEGIHFTPSKQNFRPSYANSNGQTVVSVRPATILEFKPKSKKSRAPMCNFLNNCCRGNQD